MNQPENRLNGLPLPVQKEITSLFGSTDQLYALLYLIAKNEHITREEKPDQWEERIKIIHFYQERTRILLDKWGINGEDMLADITSDYLEDYVNYREKDFGLTNEEFIYLIKLIP